ncbi:hypothetical protein KJ644_04440 [Candidatus Dependentiae bacterium]|nr:hypothetical protein [Candidatus Dependentiae bacterium]MBU4387688.1 hypothetical protein [Candidatus Dependentiae bacterium]MCG2756608.1 hypothetical protein [Candidatus Dependentiae bacterium]
MFKYLKTIFCFFIVLGLKNINCMQAQQSIKNIATNNSIIQNSKYIVPENHAKIIDKIFGENPIYTLRLQSSYKELQKIVENINSIQELDVPKLKNGALKPVITVFPVLHKRAFRFVNEPLFMSLLSAESKAKIMLSVNTANIKLEDVFKFEADANIPVGLKFLNCLEKDAPMFFENFIKDKATLLQVCTELIALFEPINNILTDETKNKAVEFYRKLMEQNKTK